MGWTPNLTGRAERPSALTVSIVARSTVALTKLCCGQDEDTLSVPRFSSFVIEKNLQSPNYANPVCCVATVCHQVRCMYWGHLGHLHRAISHLKGHKIVCMRYLACTFSQMKSIDMFSMFFTIWSSQTFPLEIYCGINGRCEHSVSIMSYTSLFSCLCMSMLTSNSSGNMQKHGYLGCFHAASARENISGVCVIVWQETQYLTVQWHCAWHK